MAKKTVDPDDFRMSFGDHLEELRTRLIRSLIGVAIIACGTFYFGRDIVGWLVVPLNRRQVAAGLPPTTITPTVMGGFAVYIKVALISAAVIGAPWIAYQVWQFIAAGLYAHERRVAYILAPFSVVMTALGVMFMYYILLPVSLAFLLFFTVRFGPPAGDEPGFMDFLSDFAAEWTGGDEDDTTADQVTIEEDPPPADADATFQTVPRFDVDPEKPRPGQIWVNTKQNALKVRVGEKTMIAHLSVSALVSPLISLPEYISFALWIMLGIVVAFQMPVIMLVGGWTGILEAGFLAQYRKYIVFICFVAGAILTPADPISMVVLAVPLWCLFEMGLIGIRLIQRGREREMEEDEEEEGGE